MNSCDKEKSLWIAQIIKIWNIIFWNSRRSSENKLPVSDLSTCACILKQERPRFNVGSTLCGSLKKQSTLHLVSGATFLQLRLRCQCAADRTTSSMSWVFLRRLLWAGCRQKRVLNRCEELKSFSSEWSWMWVKSTKKIPPFMYFRWQHTSFEDNTKITKPKSSLIKICPVWNGADLGN